MEAFAPRQSHEFTTLKAGRRRTRNHMTPSAFMLFDPLICGGETRKKMAVQVAKK
jgi:hypothetical protein